MGSSNVQISVAKLLLENIFSNMLYQPLHFQNDSVFSFIQYQIGQMPCGQSLIFFVTESEYSEVLDCFSFLPPYPPIEYNGKA